MNDGSLDSNVATAVPVLEMLMAEGVVDLLSVMDHCLRSRHY